MFSVDAQKLHSISSGLLHYTAYRLPHLSGASHGLITSAFIGLNSLLHQNTLTHTGHTKCQKTRSHAVSHNHTDLREEPLQYNKRESVQHTAEHV